MSVCLMGRRKRCLISGGCLDPLGQKHEDYKLAEIESLLY